MVRGDRRWACRACLARQYLCCAYMTAFIERQSADRRSRTLLPLLWRAAWRAFGMPSSCSGRPRRWAFGVTICALGALSSSRRRHFAGYGSSWCGEHFVVLCCRGSAGARRGIATLGRCCTRARLSAATGSLYNLCVWRGNALNACHRRRASITNVSSLVYIWLLVPQRSSLKRVPSPLCLRAIYALRIDRALRRCDRYPGSPRSRDSAVLLGSRVGRQTSSGVVLQRRLCSPTTYRNLTFYQRWRADAMVPAAGTPLCAGRRSIIPYFGSSRQR